MNSFVVQLIEQFFDELGYSKIMFLDFTVSKLPKFVFILAAFLLQRLLNLPKN